MEKIIGTSRMRSAIVEIASHFSFARLSFLVQRRDESALLDLFHVGWIDDQVWIGLFCLWVLIRKYIQCGLDNLQRGGRHGLEPRLRVLIGLFENIISRTPHVLLQNRHSSLFVCFEDMDSL